MNSLSKFNLGWIFDAFLAIAKIIAVPLFMVSVILAVIYGVAFAQAWLTN